MNNNHKNPKHKNKMRIKEEEQQTNNSSQDIDSIVIVKRKHTKVSKKKKIKKDNIYDENIYFKKKVKFGKIEIIDIENWKQINLKLTADENLKAMHKLTNEHDIKKMKNIGCRCIII